MSELRRSIEVVNQRGLHARASAKFVNAVAELPDTCTVRVAKGDNEAAGGSILGLMMLGAAKGDTIEIIVAGDNAEAVMAGLLASGHLELEGKTFHVRNRDLPRGGAETRLLSLGDTFGWKTFVRAIDSGYEEARDTLRAAGLLTGSGKVLKARLLSIIPMVVIILFGLYRFDEGKALGEPVGVLGVLIALGLVVIVWRLLAGIRRTREGDRAMRDARQEHVGLKRAPTRDQMALGVAIFGTTVLAGTPFDPLHAMRHGGGGDVGYAGDGGGDGDGGSGCGGGGCGGCGG